MVNSGPVYMKVSFLGSRVSQQGGIINGQCLHAAEKLGLTGCSFGMHT